MMKTIATTIGNTLVGKGFTRSAAFVQAWGMTKARHITRVVGVTVGNRQEALRRLARYGRDQIRVALVHEAGNQVDGNAVAVIVEVAGSRGYKMGYIAREAAAILARALDKVGGKISATVEEITGGTIGLNAGLCISYKLGGVA